MKRWLCIDSGERRIGLAVGTQETALAFPRPPIDTRECADPIDLIVKTAEEERVDAVVIGWPLYPNGNLSAKTEAVTAFAQRLAERTSLPLFRHDEAYSTVIAKERTAHFSTKRKKEKKGDLDSAAATVILQEFLEFPEAQREQF